MQVSTLLEILVRSVWCRSSGALDVSTLLEILGARGAGVCHSCDGRRVSTLLEILGSAIRHKDETVYRYAVSTLLEILAPRKKASINRRHALRFNPS